MKAVIFDCFGVLSTNGLADEALFAYIRDELKPRFKIGLLSNAGSNMLGELFEPQQVELFDATVLSYETGTVKPDPAIYQFTADKLGVLAEECIFVDDIDRFCVAAEDVGMKVICHSDAQTTITRIKELLNA